MNNATRENSQISGSPSEITNITSFRRSVTTSSLSDTSPEMRKNDSNLRRSLRKWHKRMKNCFSRSLTQRQPIQILHEPTSSLTENGFETTNNENIYTVDPLSQRKLIIPEQSHSNSISSVPSPGADGQPRSPAISETSETSRTPKSEVSNLAHQVWYWGPVSKSLVESKLDGAPDGSFLVRDSASDRHIFSISLRSVGKTLHTRIEHTTSGYQVCDHRTYETVKELVDESMRISSEEGLLCYTKSRGDEPNYPVRLLKPISRYDEVRSLQNLARFVIRQHINVNDIEKLSLPSMLIAYLKDERYFYNSK